MYIYIYIYISIIKKMATRQCKSSLTKTSCILRNGLKVLLYETCSSFLCLPSFIETCKNSAINGKPQCLFFSWFILK